MDLNQYISRFNITITDFKHFCQKFLIEEAEEVLNEARERTPVDTGALRASWDINTDKIQNIEVTIENPQNYASFVEYGTKNYKVKKDGYKMVTIPIQKYQTRVEKDFETSFINYYESKVN